MNDADGLDTDQVGEDLVSSRRFGRTQGPPLPSLSPANNLEPFGTQQLPGQQAEQRQGDHERDEFHAQPLSLGTIYNRSHKRTKSAHRANAASARASMARSLMGFSLSVCGEAKMRLGLVDELMKRFDGERLVQHPERLEFV